MAAAGNADRRSSTGDNHGGSLQFEVGMIISSASGVPEKNVK